MSVKGGGNERVSGEVAAISRIMGYRMAGARGGSVHTLLILTGCDIGMRRGPRQMGEGQTAGQGSAAFRMVSENRMSRRRSKSDS